MVRPVARRQPPGPGGRRLAADGRPVHRGRHLRLEHRAPRGVHGRGPGRDPRHRPRPGDGRTRRLDLPVPEGPHRSGTGRDHRPVEAGGGQNPARRVALCRRRFRGQLVPLRRKRAMVVAEGLLRCGQRHIAVHRDDQGRRPVRGDDASDGAGRLGRVAPRSLPAGRGARRPLGLPAIIP